MKKDQDLRRHHRDAIAINTAIARCQDIQDIDGENVIIREGLEVEHLRVLDRVQRAVRKLIEKDKQEGLFFVGRRYGNLFKVSCKPSMLPILNHLETIHQILEIYQHHELNPHFDLLARCLHEVGLLEFGSRFTTCYGDAVALSAQLNDCLDRVWTIGRSKPFQVAKKNFFRSSQKNHKQVLKYIRAHSKCTGRILLARVDVSLKSDAGMRQLNWTKQMEVMHENRKLLFKFIRKTYKSKFLGFVWKLEYGVRKGLHFHLILIFNSRDLTDNVLNRIRQEWVGPITDHEGICRNCNAFKNGYQSLGIGAYSRKVNPEMWPGIEAMCDYVTKPDDLVRLWKVDNMRTMGKGNMPQAEGDPDGV